MADRTWDSINRSVINGGPISDGSDYKMMAGKSSKELLDEALDQRHREFIGGNQFKDIQKVFNRENELNLSDEEIFMRHIGLSSKDASTSNAYVDMARINSIGSDKVVTDERKKVKTDKKTMEVYKKTALFVAGVTAVCALVFSGLSVSKAMETYNLAKNTIGYQSVDENTHRTEDNKGYWYDTTTIASDIASSNDYDDNIYGAYYKIDSNGANVFGTMNDIIAKSSDYTDFTDYLRDHGLLKDDGTIDINKYEAQASMALKEHMENNTGERTR